MINKVGTLCVISIKLPRSFGNECSNLSCNITDKTAIFLVADPHVWNKLLSHLRLVQSADTSRRHLKTVYLPGFFTMTLLGTLVVLLHVRHRR